MNIVMASVFGILLSWGASHSDLISGDLTKEDVKKLMDAKVSESTILAYIQTHGPVAPLSSNDLVELKEAGASQALLNALVKSSTPSPQAPPPQPYEELPRRNYSSYYYSSPYYWSSPYFYSAYSHQYNYYPRYYNDFGHRPQYQSHPFLHSYSPSTGHSGNGTRGGGHGGGGHGHR
jgi:hypothetical protein